MTRQKGAILLVANYSFDRSESMNRYAALLRRLLTERGHEVRMVAPPQIFGRLKKQESGLGKWLGYIDKYLLFPWRLVREARHAKLVHICDQGNASYTRLLGKTPTVVTCHDMFAIRAGLGTLHEHQLRPHARALQALNRRGLELADVVVCVSDYTREELLRFTSCDPARTRVALNPLNFPYTPASPSEVEETLASIGIDAGQRYFFHISGNYPYKNRVGVARIFRELRNLKTYADARLILAGKRWSPELRRAVADLGLHQFVTEVEDPSNEVLRVLYSGALALIFPSLYEGFGWPLIEAQACGCPVATSDRRPMSDVVGDSGILFDPLDPALAAARIAQGLAESALLRQRGLANASRFSAPAMVKEVEMAYDQALQRKGNCILP